MNAHDVNDHPTFEHWMHAVERWVSRTKLALTVAFAGPWPSEFERDATSAIFRQVGQSNDQTFTYQQEAIRGAINKLISIDEQVELLEEPDLAPAPDPVPQTSAPADVGSEVFVVHGHDLALRDRVARLIQRLGLTPVILEEQSSAGLTIIEKFERHAGDAEYAVVLLTPDDVGAAAGQDVPDTQQGAAERGP